MFLCVRRAVSWRVDPCSTLFGPVTPRKAESGVARVRSVLLRSSQPELMKIPAGRLVAAYLRKRRLQIAREKCRLDLVKATPCALRTTFLLRRGRPFTAGAGISFKLNHFYRGVCVDVRLDASRCHKLCTSWEQRAISSI